MNKFAIGCAVATFAFLGVAQARADDSSPGVVLPDFYAAPAGSVSVAASHLTLEDDQATLIMDVATNGGALSLTTPRFGWLGEAEPYPDRGFSELRFRVNDRGVTEFSSAKAFVGSTDITDALAAGAVDPFAVMHSPPEVYPQSNALATLKKLESMGAVEEGDHNAYLAKWTIERTVGVKLKPDAKTLKITYSPRPGYAMMEPGDIEQPDDLAKYCLTADRIDALLGHPASDKKLPVYVYTIPVGIDGKAPPSLDVTIKMSDVKYAGGKTVIAFCDANGHDASGTDSIKAQSARADAKGLMHILAIEQEANPADGKHKFHI